MVLNKKSLVVFMVGLVFASQSRATENSLSATSRATQACDRVAQLYRSCSANAFDYNGTRFKFRTKDVLCDDGRALDFYDRIEDMDVNSIFMFPYQTGVIPLPEKRKHFDPGRLRVEELMLTIYGSTATEVRANLVQVPFLNQTVPFQKNLGAANALRKVGVELMAAIRTDSSLAKFMQPFTSGKEKLSGSTFSWRKIAGTNRMSTHSFATSIDLLKHSGPQYWLWDEKTNNPEKAKKGEIAYRDTHYIPRGAPIFHSKAVEIFERNGFIWGGKWNHYDTMHFEYRPELIAGVAVNCSRGFAPTSDAEYAEALSLSSLRHLSHPH